jgi:hypothetical protein
MQPVLIGGTMLWVLLIGGGEIDLLDLVSTDGYWKAKGVPVTVEAMLRELEAPEPKAPDVAALIRDLGADDYDTRERAEQRLAAMGPQVRKQVEEVLTSKDAEVVERARRILAKLDGAHVRQVRRLMAIRALAEKKDRRALPVLRGLAGSKDFFTADYTRAAIAAIEGRPHRRAAPTAAERAADVKHLPGDAGIVWQRSTALGSVLPLDRIATATAATTTRPASVPVGGFPGPSPSPTALLEHLIRVAEHVGNFRVQVSTSALSAAVGPREGYFVVVARGRFDAQAIRRALREAKAPTRKLGTVEAFCLTSPTAMLIPVSDERLIAAFGPDQQNLPAEALTEALASGDGGLGKDPKMAALLNSADRTDGIWAVARISESYRRLDVLGPFEEARLTAERRADGLHVRLTAVGTDAEKVKQAAARFEQQLKGARDQVDRQAERASSLKAYVTALDTVKVQVDGKQVTVGGIVKADQALESPLLVMALRMTMAMNRIGRLSEELRDAPVPGPPDEDVVPVIPDPPP